MMISLKTHKNTLPLKVSNWYCHIPKPSTDSNCNTENKIFFLLTFPASLYYNTGITKYSLQSKKRKENIS
jgi:hypothetical protein